VVNVRELILKLSKMPPGTRVVVAVTDETDRQVSRPCSDVTYSKEDEQVLLSDVKGGR
jgi:hypothetical protein